MTTTVTTQPAICDCVNESHRAYDMEAGVIVECARCGSLTMVPYTNEELADARDWKFIKNMAGATIAMCVVFAVILCLCAWAR